MKREEKHMNCVLALSVVGWMEIIEMPGGGHGNGKRIDKGETYGG